MCMYRVHIHTLTLMSGFMSSSRGCRSADNRIGDGGNMAISSACRDREQTFVSFNVWELRSIHMHERLRNVCVPTSISWASSIVCLFLSLSFSSWRVSSSLCSSLLSHSYTTNREQKRSMSVSMIRSHTSVTYLWWSEKTKSSCGYFFFLA